MEPVKVRFGTPEPVKFREYDTTILGMDIECAARMAFESVVTGYDGTKYACVEDVIVNLRAMALQSVTDCLKEWPKGRSVIRDKNRDGIAEYLDLEFGKAGIEACTELLNFSLTEECEKIYAAKLDEVIQTIAGPYAVNNEGQPTVGVPSPLPVGMGEWLKYVQPSSVDVVNPNKEFKPETMDASPLFVDERNGAGDRYCRQCGEKRGGNARFCSNCDAKFGDRGRFSVSFER